MASNPTKRLDKLERLIRERTQVDHPPVYVSSAENAPEGAIVIERVFVDPPKREQEQLPALTQEPSDSKDVFGVRERRLIEYPRLGLPKLVISNQRSLL
jgi:hypothetical protein